MDQWADLCDRMVEMDADIRAASETRLAAIAGARWFIEPGVSTGDPQRDMHTAAAAQFAERVIAGIIGLEVAVQESLDGINKGIAAHEIEWVDDGNAVVPSALHWVHARRFRWDRETWTPQLVDTGDISTTPAGIPLTEDGWIIHTPKTVANYPTRVGVLRACAWPYLFRRWSLQFWVQGAESFAWPFLYGRVPRGATDEVRTRMQLALETMTVERRAVIDDGDAFALLETTVKDGGTWKDLFAALGNEMKKAVLGMTDLNEPSRIGAYAAVEIRRGTTVDARIAMDERALSMTWSQQLLEPLIRFNTHLFGGVVPPIPRIRWSVAATRKEIPQHLLPYATEDEIRASIDLDPRPPREAESVPVADVAMTALNGAQVTSLQGLLAAIALKQLAPGAALIAIKSAFPSISPVDAAKMVEEQAALVTSSVVESQSPVAEKTSTTLPE